MWKLCIFSGFSFFSSPKALLDFSILQLTAPLHVTDHSAAGKEKEEFGLLFSRPCRTPGGPKPWAIQGKEWTFGSRGFHLWVFGPVATHDRGRHTTPRRPVHLKAAGKQETKEELRVPSTPQGTAVRMWNAPQRFVLKAWSLAGVITGRWWDL